jgi:hypothetical protein
MPKRPPLSDAEIERLRKQVKLPIGPTARRKQVQYEARIAEMGDRVSLHPVHPLAALRALLHTPEGDFNG